MFSLKNKVALWVTGCWIIFWLFFCYVAVAAGDPSKYLFRYIVSLVIPSLFFLWITDTLRPLKAWLDARSKH